MIVEYIMIIPAAFGAALLTFFSGFGLGTILMPVFAIPAAAAAFGGAMLLNLLTGETGVI